MQKKANVNLPQADESKDEIIGILIAISIVSKRLAKKLSQLENPKSKKESEDKNLQ